MQRMPAPLALRRTLLAWSTACCTLGAFAGERVLRVGVPEGMPGYAQDAENALRIDDAGRQLLLNCIERQLPARFRWEVLPTRRVLQELAGGRLDLAFPMGFTPERAKSFAPSAPVWLNPDVWLSLKPVDPKDKGLRIAARLGSPQHVDPVAEGYTRVTGYASYAELPRTLSLDMADAVVVPQSFYEGHRADWPAEVLVTPGRPRSSGFYVANKDPLRLLGPLNRAIEACKPTLK